MHTIRDYLIYAGLDSAKYSQLQLDLALGSARIDSRLVQEGDVFFALKGQNQKGEDFIPSALEKGAALVFASKACEREEARIIKVDDVYQSFKSIVAARLRELRPRVVGITGSVGKTSTRNFCYAVLSEKFKVHKARGNYNTATGIMMTIMDAPDDTDIMLLEMGIDTAGEMEELVSIARPTLAIITNIGESHIERLGSREGIFREKSVIFKHFSGDDCLIVRGGDAYLDAIEEGGFKLRRVYQSLPAEHRPSAYRSLVHDVAISLEGTRFRLNLGTGDYAFRLRQIGEHMAFDAALALMLGLELGLSEEEMARGLLKTELEKMRFELIGVKNYTLINDSYNSSFTSLMASLQTAMRIKKTRLIAVIGDILEIGEDPALEHAKIGQTLSKLDVDLIYFYGESMRYAYEAYEGGARYYGREDMDGLLRQLEAEIREGDIVLCKASRSLALERVVDYLLDAV